MKERTTLIIIAALIIGGAIAVAIFVGPEETSTVAPTPGASAEEPEAPAPIEAAEDVAPAAAPVPTAAASVGTTLKLDGSLSHPFVMQGVGTAPAYLQVDVKAIAHDAQERAPLDVAIVIDRSGSMMGEKLRDAKASAAAFVARLRPEDRVAVIQYDHTAQIVAPFTKVGDSPTHLQSRIQSIGNGGGTDIFKALTLTEKTFSALPVSNEASVRRVLLLSDGQAGRQEDCFRVSSTMRESGVVSTTMGLGADYNEIMMTGIADNGGGNYYFIDDVAKLQPTFDKEFATLDAVVAKNTTVTIDLADGVALKTLHGFKYTQSGSRLTVPLATFWSERSTSMLLELEVDRSKPAKFDAVTLSLNYQDLITSKPAEHTATLEMATTAATATVDKNLNGDVLFRLEEIRNAKAYETAMNELEAGNQAEAKKILQKRQVQLEQSSDDLDKLSFASKKKGAKINHLRDKANSYSKDLDSMAGLGSKSAPAKRKFIKKNRASSYGSGKMSAF